MALIWHANHGNRRYEVRSAGATLRLYTNGAFHSQFNPNRLLTGGIWDMLAVPALFARDKPARLLMLGVGGGAAIHTLDRLLAPTHIRGIELDPVHLDIARDHFHSNLPNVTLVCADAVRWIARQRAKYDLVIDDLFLDAPNDPARPVTVDGNWLRKLVSRTSARGMLLQNHLSPRLAAQVVTENQAMLRAHFGTALVFTMPTYTNGILALYRDPVDARHARQQAIRIIADLDPRAARRLSFRCSTLFG